MLANVYLLPTLLYPMNYHVLYTLPVDHYIRIGFRDVDKRLIAALFLNELRSKNSKFWFRKNTSKIGEKLHKRLWKENAFHSI